MNKEERIEQLRRRGIIFSTVTLAAGTAVMVTISKNIEAKSEKVEGGEKVENFQNPNEEMTVEERSIIDEIMKEYNEKSDTKISIEDIGIIKSQPNFLIERKSDDGTIEYEQNYNTTQKELKDNEKYVYSYEKGENGKEGNFENYVIVNRDDDTIIYEMGKAYSEILDNFTTKSIIANNTQYLDGSIDISFDFENEEEKEKIYEELEEEFQNQIKNKENDKETDAPEL